MPLGDACGKFRNCAGSASPWRARAPDATLPENFRPTKRSSEPHRHSAADFHHTTPLLIIIPLLIRIFLLCRKTGGQVAPRAGLRISHPVGRGGPTRHSIFAAKRRKKRKKIPRFKQKLTKIMKNSKHVVIVFLRDFCALFVPSGVPARSGSLPHLGALVSSPASMD